MFNIILNQLAFTLNSEVFMARAITELSEVKSAFWTTGHRPVVILIFTWKIHGSKYIWLVEIMLKFI